MCTQVCHKTFMVHELLLTHVTFICNNIFIQLNTHDNTISQIPRHSTNNLLLQYKFVVIMLMCVHVLRLHDTETPSKYVQVHIIDLHK